MKIIKPFAIASAAFLLCSVQHSFAATTWDYKENIDVNKQWKIKFNHNIDQASITNNIYILQGNNKIFVNASVYQNIISVKPIQQLNYSTEYELIIGDQIKDTVGKNIKSSVIVPFSTEQKMDKYMEDAVETFQSEYEMTWNLPKVDYNHFRLIGTDSNQNIVGGYEPTKGTSLFGIKVGANRFAVTSKYCDPISGVAFNSNALPYYTINFYRK